MKSPTGEGDCVRVQRWPLFFWMEIRRGDQGLFSVSRLLHSLVVPESVKSGQGLGDALPSTGRTSPLPSPEELVRDRLRP